MIKSIKRTSIASFDLIQYLGLLFMPILISYGLYKVIPIRNVEPLSIVSVAASINLIIWIFIILQILFTYPLLMKYSKITVVQINLVIILIYVSSLKILIKALSLKGTPLPGSDIRGDLLNIVKLAEIAKSDFWSGGINPVFSNGGYPPIWPTIIGNVARVLDTHVLTIFKPAEFILLAASPIFVLYLWRLVLDTWMALVVTINQSLVFNFDYKTLTLNLLIPLLIYIVLQLKDSSHNSYFKYGVFFGLISLSYFGYIYWLIPFMILIPLLLLTLQNKEKNFSLHTFVYLGLGVGLGPVIYFRLIDNILIYYVALLAAFILLNLLRNFKFLYIATLAIINVGIFSGLLMSFLFFRTADTWSEGGVDKNDPTGGPLISLSDINLFLFLLLLIATLFVTRSSRGTTVTIVLAGVYLSSTIFMYFIASQMQVTYRVDLWPRAREVQSYALNLIFLVIFLYFINHLLKEHNFKRILELNSKNLFYMFSFVLLILGSYLVSTLGSLSYRSMPFHAFGPSWFAHQGCANPHEDPMLSKVFEQRPDIQAFLRKNCPSASWPEIPSSK